MGVVVVASGSSPSAYIQGLIRRIDRGDPNVSGLGICFKGPLDQPSDKITAIENLHPLLYNLSLVLL